MNQQVCGGGDLPRTIEELYDLIAAESKYSTGERDKLAGMICLLFAITLGALFLAFSVMRVDWVWLIFLAPSLVIGLVGFALFHSGQKMTEEAFHQVRSRDWYPKSEAQEKALEKK